MACNPVYKNKRFNSITEVREFIKSSLPSAINTENKTELEKIIEPVDDYLTERDELEKEIGYKEQALENYKLAQELNNQGDIIDLEILNMIPKITPESAEKETGAKVETKGENISSNGSEFAKKLTNPGNNLSEQEETSDNDKIKYEDIESYINLLGHGYSVKNVIEYEEQEKGKLTQDDKNKITYLWGKVLSEYYSKENFDKYIKTVDFKEDGYTDDGINKGSMYYYWKTRREYGEKLINKSNNNIAAKIPQNLISGEKKYGTLQYAKPEVKKVLGENPHSIDMIEAGFRTRTTRSVGEMEKYNIKVGDIIEHVGISAKGKEKHIKAVVTAIHPKGTPGYLNTWYKEGWTQEGIKHIERYKNGAVAIEFKVIDDKSKQIKQTQPEKQTIQEVKIEYTPEGKQKQTYTIKEDKIFNSSGKEVFIKGSVDRNKIFANLAVKQGRAIVITYKNNSYVVDDKNQIISVKTGKTMLWTESNGNRIEIINRANEIRNRRIANTGVIPTQEQIENCKS